MTEKRFTVIREVYQVYKDLTLYEVSDGTHTFLIYENAQELTDLLNELVDENKQLKKDCSILIQSNQDYRKENEQLKTKNNAYIQDIEVFKEENTHLKLENEQLKSLCITLIKNIEKKSIAFVIDEEIRKLLE